MRTRRAAGLASAAAIALLGSIGAVPAAAAELIVTVDGVPDAQGEVGCALYSQAAGFPMDVSGAVTVRVPAQPGKVVCRFEGVAPGRYALAVLHDANGNRQTDTSFLGFPKEAWGVSNGVRPTFRAPTFEEALFDVPADAPQAISIRIAK